MENVNVNNLVFKFCQRSLYLNGTFFSSVIRWLVMNYSNDDLHPVSTFSLLENRKITITFIVIFTYYRHVLSILC